MADADAPAETPAASSEEKNDGEEGKKKDGETPATVEHDAKSFDGFLYGMKPNGKRRRCTDCLCLLMIVSSYIQGV